MIFDEVGDDFPCLIVGEHEVLRRFGIEKGLAETAHGCGLTFENHFPVVGGHGHAPGGIALRFFEDGNALTEPTGHAVFGGGEGDDMTKLMPKGGLPIVPAMPEATWAVHGDDRAKTSPENALATEISKGADGEVLLTGKELDEDRALKRELVALAKKMMGLFEQFECTWSIDGPLTGWHFKGEVRGALFVVRGDLFLEITEVKSLDVVSVLCADGGGEFEGLRFVA